MSVWSIWASNFQLSNFLNHQTMKPSNHQTIYTQGRFWAFVVSAAAMIYGFWGMFVRAMEAFRAPEEDMSFAWYVPIFSLYVLWTQRAKLLEAALDPESRPSWVGFLLCWPCIAFSLLGARGLQLRMEQLGFIGLLIALPWTFYGRRVASFFVFPALYLVFTIPVSALMDMVTLHLRFLASGVAIAVLNGFGVDAVREGTAIVAQGAHPFAIDVAEPCSGLRSLFALMALTAAYSWFNQPTWPRRALLFVMSVPLAVLGNIVRVLTICGVAACASADFALGFYHDYSGYVVFMVAIVLMVACGEAITRLAAGMALRAGAVRSVTAKDGTEPVPPDAADAGRAGRPRPADAARPEAAPYQSASGDRALSSRWLPYVAAPLFAFVFAFQAMTPAGMVMERPEFSLPDDIPGFTMDVMRYCQNEQCGQTHAVRELGDATNCPTCGAGIDICALGERKRLPSDTNFIKRRYRSVDGDEYHVSAVIGGASKRSIHRPELCLPSQGFTMMSPLDINVGGRPFRTIKIVPPNGGPSRVMAYTFFNQAGVHTASHMRRVLIDTWDRTVLNRVDRWVMITVQVFAPNSVRGFDANVPNDREALVNFLNKLSEPLP